MAVRALLEDSAQASGVEDFALRLAGRRQLSNLGPISLVLKEEPTARAALDTLCRYLRLLNASLLTRIEEHGKLLVIREEILVAQTASTRQSMELAVGVMYRIVRELLGPQWKPVRVCFNHRPPSDASAHRAFFGTAVDFNSEFNGIVCNTADLLVPQQGANPEMARFARQYPQAAERLSKAVAVALADPGIQEKIRGYGLVPSHAGPAETGAMVVEHLKRWEAPVKASGFKPE